MDRLFEVIQSGQHSEALVESAFKQLIQIVNEDCESEKNLEILCRLIGSCLCNNDADVRKAASTKFNLFNSSWFKKIPPHSNDTITSILKDFQSINKCPFKLFESSQKLKSDDKIISDNTNQVFDDLEKQQKMNKLLNLEDIFEDQHENNTETVTDLINQDDSDKVDNNISSNLHRTMNQINSIVKTITDSPIISTKQMDFDSLTFFLFFGIFSSEWTIRQSIFMIHLSIYTDENFDGATNDSIKDFSKFMYPFYLFVLCNDKFSDYVSSSVRAPIRELACKILLKVLKFLDKNDQKIIFDFILEMIKTDWQNQHTGFFFILMLLDTVYSTDSMLFCSVVKNFKPELDKIIKIAFEIISNSSPDIDDDVLCLVSKILLQVSKVDGINPKNKKYLALIPCIWSKIIEDNVGIYLKDFVTLLTYIYSLDEKIQPFINKRLKRIHYFLLNEDETFYVNGIKILSILIHNKCLNSEQAFNSLCVVILSMMANSSRDINILIDFCSKNNDFFFSNNQNLFKSIIIDSMTIASLSSLKYIFENNELIKSEPLKYIVKKFNCEIRSLFDKPNCWINMNFLLNSSKFIAKMLDKTDKQFKIDLIYTFAIDSNSALKIIIGILTLLGITENQEEIKTILYAYFEKKIKNITIFDEVLYSFQNIIHLYRSLKPSSDSLNENANITQSDIENYIKSIEIKPENLDSTLSSKNSNLVQMFNEFRNLDQELSFYIKPLFSIGCIFCEITPESLNLVLKPLIDVLKNGKEKDENLLHLTYTYFVLFFSNLNKSNQNACFKIIKTLLSQVNKFYISSFQLKDRSLVDSYKLLNFDKNTLYVRKILIDVQKNCQTSFLNFYNEKIINAFNTDSNEFGIYLFCLIESKIEEFSEIENLKVKNFLFGALKKYDDLPFVNINLNCLISLTNYIDKFSSSSPQVITSYSNYLLSINSLLEKAVDTNEILFLISIIKTIFSSNNNHTTPLLKLFFPNVFKLIKHSNSDVRSSASEMSSNILLVLNLDITLDPILVKHISDDVKKAIDIGTKFAQNLCFSNQDLSNCLDELNISLKDDLTLRSYQKKGILWLRFLAESHLNGMLCDDMGLGKTIQTLCAIYIAHKKSNQKVSSLIICPSTLSRHWFLEIVKYFKSDDLKSWIYKENMSSKNIFSHDITIAPYSMFHRPKPNFKNVKWKYIVLDEGHLIKNQNLKLTQNITELNADHKLILTGTPIQNSLWELYSLFNFLMPGYLGQYSEFRVRYIKPIIGLKYKLKNNKMNDNIQDQSREILEKLHNLTLPFILRRTKENVLKELPPKIIQDYFCDMSEMQQRIYEIIQSDSKFDDDFVIYGQDKKNFDRSYFEKLHLVRRLCNHPKIIIDSTQKYQKIVDENTSNSNLELDSFKHSGKLNGLTDLLFSYGIESNLPEENVQNENSQEESTIQTTNLLNVQNKNKFLIFYQLVSTLSLLKQFFEKNYPNMKYMIINSEINADERVDYGNRFNEDPSCNFLILSTKIASLGLNLASANVVVMFEHDWNPMVDLQAMDRAHRLGQKRSVIVHRLIMSNTIEEHIMNLQQFKKHLISTIISDENEDSQKIMSTDNKDRFIDELIKSGKSSQYKNSEKRPKLDSKTSPFQEIELWKDDEYDL